MIFKNLMIIFSFIAFLNAVDINLQTLQKIIEENPNDVDNRLLLAKHYIDNNNFDEAKKYIAQALTIDPKSKTAVVLKVKIKSAEKLTLLLQSYEIDNINDKNKILTLLDKLYTDGKYKEYTSFFTRLNLNSFAKEYLRKDDKIKMARIYVWDGKYNSAKNIIKELTPKYEKDIDIIDLNAQICFYGGNYKCSANYYQILYNSTGQKDYALRLLESYYYGGDADNARTLLNKLRKYYPNDKNVQKIDKSIADAKKKRLESLKDAFEKSPNDKTLQAYTGALFEFKMGEDALKITKYYVDKNPKDIASQVLYANYLSWSGKNKEATEFLKKIVKEGDYEIKLQIGKFLSWDGQFEEAIKYLEDVATNTKDKSLIYEAKKALAFCDLWQNKKKEAKEKFDELIKLNPNDKDIKNALLNLSNNPQVLIRVYLDKLKTEPQNTTSMLELGNLYYKIGDENKALYYLEKYYEKNPENIEVAKSMSELYLKKKNVYKGFGLLEYYAYTKDSPEALLYLAKNYYWNGFSQEAVDVLNKLLKDSPNHKEAKELKATILKISPSYTRSNSGATIEEHLGKVANSTLAIAYRLYNNYFYQASLTYFGNYLKEKPEDYVVREKYAYALEFSGYNKEAAGEFFLMFWQKNSVELKYHYAYNLMKGGSLKEAKKIFLELKDDTFAPAPEFINEFLKGWEAAWESLNFDLYKNFYSDKMLRSTTWVVKKQYELKNANFVAVAFYDPLIKKDKNGKYITTFYEEFATKGKTMKGYRTLVINCGLNEQNCKIEKESWKKGEYKKDNGLTPLIDGALKYIENPPLTINQKSIKSKTQNVANLSNKKSKIPMMTQVKDIFLAPTVKKNLEVEDEILNTVFMNYRKIDTFDSLFKDKSGKYLPVYETARSDSKFKNKMGIEYLTFSDSDKVSMKRKNIYYERKSIFKGVDAKVELGDFLLKKKERSLNGTLSGITLIKDNFYAKLGTEMYDNKIKLSPEIGCNSVIGKHNLALSYKRDSAFFINNSFCMVDKNITSDLFSIADRYDNDLLWANITFNKLSDGNSVITPQFNLQLYEKSLLKNIKFKLSLGGWYQMHSQKNDCYYSPNFTDSTTLRADVKFPIFSNLYFNLVSGYGYSYESKSYPYNYGFNIDYPLINKFELSTGCMYYSAKRNDGKSSYSFNECNVNINYRW